VAASQRPTTSTTTPECSPSSRPASSLALVRSCTAHDPLLPLVDSPSPLFLFDCTHSPSFFSLLGSDLFLAVHCCPFPCSFLPLTVRRSRLNVLPSLSPAVWSVLTTSRKTESDEESAKNNNEGQAQLKKQQRVSEWCTARLRTNGSLSSERQNLSCFSFFVLSRRKVKCLFRKREKKGGTKRLFGELIQRGRKKKERREKKDDEEEEEERRKEGEESASSVGKYRGGQKRGSCYAEGRG
jgi:hypothetical protein